MVIVIIVHAFITPFVGCDGSESLLCTLTILEDRAAKWIMGTGAKDRSVEHGVYKTNPGIILESI